MATIKFDMIGKKFGMLTGLSLNYVDKDRELHWNFKCDCGNFCIKRGKTVRAGQTTSCGCQSKTFFKDLTGQINNKLTLVQYNGKNKYKNHTYIAQCSCGNKINVEGSDFKTGKVKSCGCLKFEKQINKMLENPKASTYNTLYAGYRRAAIYRGLNFDIMKDTFFELIKKDCYYCGSEPMNIKNNHKNLPEAQIRYSGLDRLDNNIGYTLENVVPCCKICNQAKHNMPKNMFLNWINKVYNFNITKQKENL